MDEGKEHDMRLLIIALLKLLYLNHYSFFVLLSLCFRQCFLWQSTLQYLTSIQDALRLTPPPHPQAVHPKLARIHRKEVAGGKGRTYYHPLLDTSSATKEQKNMLDIVCERIMY
jgi:hypothetical protein